MGWEYRGSHPRASPPGPGPSISSQRQAEQPWRLGPLLASPQQQLEERQEPQGHCPPAAGMPKHGEGE